MFWLSKARISARTRPTASGSTNPSSVPHPSAFSSPASAFPARFARSASCFRCFPTSGLVIRGGTRHACTTGSRAGSAVGSLAGPLAVLASPAPRPRSRAASSPSAGAAAAGAARSGSVTVTVAFFLENLARIPAVSTAAGSSTRCTSPAPTHASPSPTARASPSKASTSTAPAPTPGGTCTRSTTASPPTSARATAPARASGSATAAGMQAAADRRLVLLLAPRPRRR